MKREYTVLINGQLTYQSWFHESESQVWDFLKKIGFAPGEQSPQNCKIVEAKDGIPTQENN